MTKARLIKALDGLPDDTRILISGVRFTRSEQENLLL